MYGSILQGRVGGEEPEKESANKDDLRPCFRRTEHSESGDAASPTKCSGLQRGLEAKGDDRPFACLVAGPGLAYHPLHVPHDQAVSPHAAAALRGA